jgi:hypothetical protein
MIYKFYLTCIAVSLNICSYASIYAQITDVNTSVGYIMHPTSRSSLGMNQVVNQTAPVHDIAIGFKVFKTPFRLRFRFAYPNSEFIAYKSDPFYNTDSSEGFLVGYAIEKVLPIYHSKKHVISFNTGFAIYGNNIKSDNDSFAINILAFTEPNYRKDVEVRPEHMNTSVNLYLTNSLNYSLKIWRKVNVGMYAQFDYGFGESADFYLSQTVLRSSGFMDVDLYTDTIQKVSILRNFLSFGFTFGVGL